MNPPAVVLAAAILLVESMRAVAMAQQISVPLPIVPRAISTSEASVFGKPDVIVMARVTQRCEAEQQSDSPVLPTPPGTTRQYFNANYAEPVRLNKRAPEDPDLGMLMFSFRPREDEARLPLTLGHTYVLLLDAIHYAPMAGPDYTVAHPQVGFEIVEVSGESRVKPIIRGGELDGFDGKPLEDVLRAIRRREK